MNTTKEFRAWEEVGKVMHHNFQFIKSGDEYNDWLIFTSDKQDLKSNPHPFDNPWFQAQFKITQYTGMLDVKRNKIFEGDIVECILIDSKGVKNKYKGTVISSEFEYCIELEDNHWPVASFCCVVRCEVVGNVFENPDQLGELV